MQIQYGRAKNILLNKILINGDNERLKKSSKNADKQEDNQEDKQKTEQNHRPH